MPPAEPTWVTFLSDYGLEDTTVGVCHGVIARLAPQARVIDLCHHVARHNVEDGATTLAASVPYLPVGLHLTVVDPLGKTHVPGIAVRTADGSVFVSPDNGVTSLSWAAAGGVVEARVVTNRDLFLPNASPVFRGRDMFAPVVARLASGTPLADVGPRLDPDELVQVTLRDPVVDTDHVHGEVRSLDHFGNLSLNVCRSDLEAAGIALGDTVELRLNGRSLLVPFTVTYGDVPTGRLAVCEDSYRQITIAVNRGDAARTLRAARGDAIVISRVARQAAQPPVRIGVYDPPPQLSTG